MKLFPILLKREPVASRCAQSADEASLGVAIAGHLARTLQTLPSVFGQLVHVATLWDPGAGVYRLPPFGTAATRKPVDSVVSGAHADIFQAWMALTLRQQCDDVVLFLDFEDPHACGILQAMCDNGMLDYLPPPDCTGEERDGFLHGVAAIVERFRKNAVRE